MKKDLAKAIVLGLLTASVCSVASADDLTVKDKSGWSTYNVAHQVVDKTESFENININMSGNGMDAPSALLIFANKDKVSSIIGTGDISIVNTCDPVGELPTVNGIYATGKGASIDFSKANSVYIDSHVGTEKGDAISAKEGATVKISTNKDEGFTQVIGDIDFDSNSFNVGFTTTANISANGTVELDINNDKSFWYGDEQNLYEEYQNKKMRWAEFKEKYPAQAEQIIEKAGNLAFLLNWITFVVTAQGSGKLDLSLSNGGEWIYTNNPNLSNVKLNKDGIINLVDVEINKKFDIVGISDGTKLGHRYVILHNLNTDDAKGGIFKLDLQYNDVSKEANYELAKIGKDSDYIFVKAGSGSYDIQFDTTDSKLESMANGDKLFFANDESGEIGFISSTVDALPEINKASDIFKYKYEVGSQEAEEGQKGNDWFITVNPNGENENVSSVEGAMKAGYALGTEMDRLNKRLGESRYLTDEKGLWVRYRHARVGMDSSFKTNSNMFQLGYDKERIEDDGRHYRGGALDYTHGDTSLYGLSGNGEHDRYSLSLYDTWMGDKGHYRDLVIRAGRLNSEFDINTRNSDNIASDYHQWFGSISGEWGRKKDTGHDWYFEPQTQLQLARVGAADYVTNYGVRVEQDAATSLIGRVGFRLGREYDKHDATKRDNYYIKADLMHEFCGDQEYKVTGADGTLRKEFDGKDTWFDVGIGADITVSRNTYFWVDVERTLGGDYDRTWQINGGLRWEW